LGGALGVAAFLRLRRRSGGAFERSDSDPADELRARLEEARDSPAAEPEPEAPRSIEERRRAIHDKAQQALGEMNQSDPDG
jgi:hypothetical protein